MATNIFVKSNIDLADCVSSEFKIFFLILNPLIEYKQSAFTLSSRIKLGRQKIEEAKLKLPALNDIKQQYEAQQPFESINLAICSPIDANTGMLAF